MMIRHKNEVAEARKSGTKLPQVPKDIGVSIMLICNNLIKKPNFSSYSIQYKQEMISDAALDCIAAIDNFDPEKTNNPFAYFTQIAWNAYIRRIQKEKKQQYIKLKNYENTYVVENPTDDPTHFKFNEITSNAIQAYEEKYLGPKTEVKKPKPKKGIDKFLD